MQRASDARRHRCTSTLTRPGKTLESKTLGAGRGAYKVFPGGSGSPWTNVGRCSIQRFASVLAAGSSPPRHCRSQPCRERVCSFVTSWSSRSSSSMRRPDRVNGPARVCGPRLRRRRPDTMAVGDVLPRTGRPSGPLGVPHPYPVADPLGLSARSARVARPAAPEAGE
jgi:hypothetical protein